VGPAISFFAGSPWQCFLLFFYLFNGRFVPRWTPLARLGWAVYTVSFLVFRQSSARLTSKHQPISQVIIWILIWLAAAVFAQIYRLDMYRGRRLNKPNGLSGA